MQPNNLQALLIASSLLSSLGRHEEAIDALCRVDRKEFSRSVDSDQLRRRQATRRQRK